MDELKQLEGLEEFRQPDSEEMEIQISQEEVTEVMKGKRPENMNYNVFRQVRKDINKHIKNWKKGQMKHLSVYFTEEVSEDNDKVTVKHTKTYIKPVKE